MKIFDLYPAIDIKNGQCVRLLHGKMENVTIYNTSPLNQVEHFIKMGCKWVHIVDIDAAVGSENNENLILNILSTFKNDIKIQLGGGIRSSAKIKYWLERGIARTVIGTLAYKSPDIVNLLGDDCKNKICLAIDVRDNKIAVNGWKEQLKLSPLELINKIDKSLLNSIIYTDITRDGTLKGINKKQTVDLSKKVSLPIIASGGVSSIKDVKDLYSLKKFGIIGVIVGKALYENILSISEINKVISK